MARRTVVKDGYRYIYEGDTLVKIEPIKSSAKKVNTSMTQAEKDARSSSREASKAYNTDSKFKNTDNYSQKNEVKTKEQTINEREIKARESASKVKDYMPKKKTSEQKTTERELRTRKSAREVQAYKDNRREFELETNRRRGKSDELYSLVSQVYKQERGKDININNIASDYKDLADLYNQYASKFGKEYVSPDEMKTLSEKIKSFAKNKQNIDKYIDIYGRGLSDDERKMYENMSESIPQMRMHTDNATKDYGNYKSKQDYSDYKLVERTNDYKTLTSLRSTYERAGNKTLVDAITKKIATPEIISQMSDSDIISEKKRIDFERNSLLSDIENTMPGPGSNLSYTKEGYAYYDAKKGADASEKLKGYNDAKHKYTQTDLKYDDYSSTFNNAVIDAQALKLVNDYIGKSDFETKNRPIGSKYTESNGTTPTVNSENEFKLIYNAVNGDADTIATSRKINSILDGVPTTFDFGVIRTMTEEEKGVYNYIVNTKGLESGAEFIYKLAPVLDKRKTTEDAQNAYLYAQEHPYLSLLSNVASAPIQAVSDLGLTARDLINGIRGDEINAYDEIHRGQAISSAMSEGGQSAFKSGIGKTLYSIAETGGKEAMLYAATLGVGKALNIGAKGLSAINMIAHSGSAFEGKLIQYKKAGYDDANAILAGLVSASIEAVTEAMPLERIIKTPDVLKSINTSRLAQIIKRAGVSGIEEGLEEGASYILGDMYDIFTNHEKLTTYYQVYNEAIRNGKSENDAKTEAFLESLGELGQNMLAGAFVGFGMSAANSYSTVMQADKIKNIATPYFTKNGANADNTVLFLAQLGYEVTPETIKLAQTVTDYANGKSISPEFQDTINNTAVLRGVTAALASVGENTQSNTESETAPVTVENEVETTDLKTDVYNALVGEKLSSTAIDNIIDNGDMRNAFTELTGIEIQGTKAEQRAIVRDFQNDARNIEDLKLKKSGYESIELTSAHEKVNSLLEKTNSENVGKIVRSANLTHAFEELTGVTLSGNMSEMRQTVKDNAELARNVYSESVKADRGNIRQSVYRNIGELSNDNSNDNFTDTADNDINVVSYDKKTQKTINQINHIKTQIENVDPENINKTLGRSGAKVYSNFIAKDSGLITELKKTGITTESAQNMADSIFYFMYDAGKNKTDINAAVSAIENIYPGIKSYSTAFYYAGVNDSNLMQGKLNSKIVENDVVKNMRASKLLDKRSEDAINIIASRLGIDVEFVDDLGEGNNGSFNPKTGELKISKLSDIPYVEAVLHESVHGIRSISPESYNNIADLVFEVISNNNDAFSSSWKYIGNIYKNQITDKDGNINRELVNEELVANVISKMLFNQDYINELVGIDKGRVRKIWEAIKDFFDKLFKRYNRTPFISLEMEPAMELLNKHFNEIKSMYESALSATESVQKDGITTASNGQIVSIENDSEVMFNKAQWDKNGREFLKSYFKKNKIDADMASQVMEFMDMMAKESESLENEFPLYGNWAVYEVVKGENGAPMSAIVKNGEYTLNIDFSTKCVKRATLDKVLNKLANKKMLSLIKAKDDSTAIAVINGIIKKYGLDVACPMCFVDAKRQQILKWSKSFCDMWNWVIKQTVPKGEIVSDFAFAGKETSNTVDTLTEADFTDIMKKVPKKFKTDKGNVKPILERIINLIKSDSKYMHTMTVEDMASSQGLDAIKSWSADMYQIVNSHQGSAKPKLAHSEVPYSNDIANDKRFNPEAAFMVGGVRFQSFSDYVESLFFDYMQAVSELSAKGLPSHAYTKVIAFAKIFGLTGMKINMSGIPKVAELTTEQQARIDALYKDGKKSSKFHDDSIVKKLKKNAGLDADGNLLWADESIDIEEAKKLALDPEYSKNCGIIVVGVSDAHIEKLLDTDWVAQVIPYHRSGINPVVARMYNIDLFNDYTNRQNTRVPYQGKYKSINSTEIKINDFDFYGELRKLGNDPDAPKKIADKYIEWCEKAGDLSRTEPVAENKRFIPKFDTFTKHPNYYKLLTDFSMKDSNGNYAPQEAVKMNFPETETLLGYIRDSLKSQAVRETKIDKEFDNIVSEVEEAFDIEEGEMLSKSPNRTSKLKDIEPDYVRGYVKGDWESFKELVIKTMDEEIAKAKANARVTSVTPKASEKPKTSAEVIEGATFVGDDGQKVVIVPEGTPGAKKVYIDSDYEAVEKPTPKARTDELGKSRVALTTLRSGVLNGEQAKLLMDKLANDDTFGTYVKFTDKEALTEAQTKFEKIGYDQMLSDWVGVVEGGYFPDKQWSVDGQWLLKQAAKKGDMDAVMYIMSELMPSATQSAQLVQSLSILARGLSGEGQAYIQMKNLKKLEKRIRMKKGNEGITLEFDKDLMNEYIKAVNSELGIAEEVAFDSDTLSAKSEKQRKSDEILAEMWAKVSEQIPTSWAETFNLWRYASMLMSPATHLSNAFSNYAHYTNTLSKNMYASLIESIAIRDKNKRTKSVGASIKSFLPGGIRKNVDKLYNFAIDDAEKIQNDLKGDNKYDVDKTSRSKFKIVEKIGERIFGALKWEDWVMMRGHYARALSSFMQARGYKPSTITETQLDEGRKIAIEEARRATFNEANAFSQMLNEAARKNKVVDFVIGSEIPFAKVPANVLRTGVDYSPLGFVRTIGNIFNTDIDANTKIDMLARNLTGTQTFVLGAMLFAAGILSVSGDDEETEEKLYGTQKYSIKFGDKSWSLDWMAPAGIALFAGAQFWHDVTAEEEKFEIIDLIKAVPAIGESTMNILFEMTMLENLAYTLKSMQYGDGWGEKAADFISSTVFGYLGQFIPTPVGQIAKSIDNTKRGTYIDKNSKIPSYVQVGIQQLVRKIPVLYSKLAPTINEHGEEEKNSVDNVVLRTIDNLILPGSLKKIRSSSIDDELMRLYKEAPNGKDSLPKKLDKDITVNGKKKDLSADEYARYQSLFGQTYYSKLKEIIGTDYYDNLSDENKVKLLAKVKEYATEKAKSDIDSRYHPDSWLQISFETPGIYQYVIDTDPKESFGVDDLTDAQDKSFRIDRSNIVDNILKQYTPSDSDYDFADKFYDYLNRFSKEVALEKNSDGEYEIDTDWMIAARDMDSRKQAEFIYAKALTSNLKGDKLNETLYNDEFISDDVLMHLQDFGVKSTKNPIDLYETGGKGGKNLADYNISFETFADVLNTYEKIEEYKNASGKTVDRKTQFCMYVGNLNISDTEKSALYRVWYQDRNAKGKSTIKEVTWNYVWA